MRGGTRRPWDFEGGLGAPKAVCNTGRDSVGDLISDNKKIDNKRSYPNSVQSNHKGSLLSQL